MAFTAKRTYRCVGYYPQGFLQIRIAAITPGTHPAMVRSTTNKMDPHPLSYTANGGKMTHKIALPKLMLFLVLLVSQFILGLAQNDVFLFPHKYIRFHPIVLQKDQIIMSLPLLYHKGSAPQRTLHIAEYIKINTGILQINRIGICLGRYPDTLY